MWLTCPPVALDLRQPGGEAAHAGEGQPDLGIGRQRDGREAGRPERDDLDAHGGRRLAQLLVGAHDAVDLRPGRVGRDEDAHQAAADAGRAATGRSAGIPHGLPRRRASASG